MHLFTFILLLLQLLSGLALLVGPLYRGVQLVDADLKIAHKYFRDQQIKHILQESEESLISEYSLAKVWCREHEDDPEAHVSLFHHKEANFLSYSVLYRESTAHPAVVTLHAVIYNPSAPSSLTLGQAYDCLKGHCRSMYLQTHELKNWAQGKTKLMMYLDSCFEQ